MATKARKPAPRERWRLVHTIRATTPIAASTTPFADTLRKVYTQLIDFLLVQNTYTTRNGIKLREQSRSLVESKINIAEVKLFIYTKDK